ncbi:MAG TPA: ATP synthase F1 subunit epsilon [Rickettsia endosymbiont of Sericostoma sp.]|jgi:F-type H+-transporting ATPase subunit epsilon|uniref:ATP synthase F1 subunit epsilon n=1 Tax=unclassified Candidatus Tisiphia TaxID=2996318 RepID=UPI001E08FD37|nr:ATP synthase F1 subunit epsilon [Rickettsia endosymbiont of Labidopullus appendiculatus]HJD56728.1 ATP synthase F1 subunit epsilon [Rickettsia endosymbiont of Sericostoma sp. HW-2014]HJD63556.1 ATP synthase F1 subunit epsilon [Rickettsia endosymbiont of Sericostoma sp.]
MNKTIRVKIVTPINVLFDKQAQEVIMPGELGEFGVLPGHELLIASLKAGLTKITVDNSVFKYFVCSGLAEVTDSKVNIITEFAVDTSNLQPNKIIEKIEFLKKEINQENDDTKNDIIKLDIARYESLLTYLE